MSRIRIGLLVVIIVLLFNSVNISALTVGEYSQYYVNIPHQTVLNVVDKTEVQQNVEADYIIISGTQLIVYGDITTDTIIIIGYGSYQCYGELNCNNIIYELD